MRHPRTSKAEGTKLKAGAVRRLTITMDEEEFYNFRALAADDDRSISATVMRYAHLGLAAMIVLKPEDKDKVERSA